MFYQNHTGPNHINLVLSDILQGSLENSFCKQRGVGVSSAEKLCHALFALGVHNTDKIFCHGISNIPIYSDILHFLKFN